MRNSALIIAAAIFAGAVPTWAAPGDPTPEQLEFFETKVRPILAEACYKCHSVEEGKTKGSLTLDTKDGVLKGGETGPAIKPGDPSDSLLITAISYKDKDLQMPPKGEKLTAQQIADLTAWVKMGAPDPRKEAKEGAKLSGLTQSARSHWAYQPVKKPAIPAVKNRAWVTTPVDAFILHKIEEKGMLPSPRVDDESRHRQALLRRATYNLTGLPPTPREIERFLNDRRPLLNAYNDVVDRLLASDAYGERWGRFWLDTARYADTTGDRDNNQARDYRYPYAWTYRDYVIRAFNEDKPYDRFVVEQLAADKLSDLKDPRDLAALGFLTVGERFNNVNDVINDRIDVVTKGFLGMTVSCARCHDHMFDPIPTKDYYALHGIFASTVEPEEKPVIIQAASKERALEFDKAVAAAEQGNRDAYYKVIKDQNGEFRQKAAAYLEAAHLGRNNSDQESLLKAQEIIKTEKLDAVLVRYVGGKIRGDDPVFGPYRRFLDGGNGMGGVAAAVAANKDKRINPIIAAAFKGTPPQNMADVGAVYSRVFQSIDSKGRDFLQAMAAVTDKDAKVSGFEPAEIELLQAPFRASIAANLSMDQIRNEINGWPQQIRNRGRFNFARINELQLTHDGAEARAMVVTDSRQPKDSPVFIRGQSEARGEMVPRRFLEVLSGGKPTPFKRGSGRLELAQAIASKDNPLTARVIVNRVWMHHFGEGFVRTPDDLGTQAEQPSHPELIDYLSSYFMEQGWSLKKLHKLIMLSKVYQNSAYKNAKYEEMDPDNRLLWRANIRRLEFEAVRDSLLVFSGQLDRTLGGQPVNLTDEPYSFRRSVYGYIDRGNLPELMSNFDFSNPDMPNSKRTTTVVPQQALFLMNSPMVVDVARRVLQRRDVMNAPDNIRKIFKIYHVVFQRDPFAAEINLALQFIGKEIKEEPKIASAVKELTDRTAKEAADREKRSMEMMGNSDGNRSIRNTGKFVERKPLTGWETYVQTLLLSNEAAYIN